MTTCRGVACWISKATRAQAQARARESTPTHRDAYTRTPPYRNMQYLLLFHGNNGFVNAPHCYVIRALPVLLRIVYLHVHCNKPGLRSHSKDTTINTLL